MDLNSILSKKWVQAGVAAGLTSVVLTSFLGGCVPPSSGAPPVAEVASPIQWKYGPITPESNKATSPNLQDGREYYYYLLGQILLRERNWHDAERALTEVTKVDPSSVEARMLVSHLATQRGDLKKAIRLAEEVVGLDPKHEKARKLLAGLLTATKSFKKSAEQYEEILKISPKELPPRVQLAQLYGRLKRMDQARETLAPLFKDPALAWKAHLALGRAYVNIPDLEKAAIQFYKAYKLDPNRIKTVLALGAVLQELNRAKEAEKVYRDFIATHPDSKEIHSRLGRLLLNQDDQDAALTEFQAISQISPDSVPARMTSALILLSQKRFEDALQELRLAEATQPEDSNVHYYLGQVLESLDRFREAEISYGKVAPLETFHTEAQLRLAFLEAEGGRRGDGIRRIRTLLDADQTAAEEATAPRHKKKRITLMVALNVLLMQDEKYLDVVETATQGLEKDPNHGRLRFNRAMALDKLGRWPEAEKDLLAYIEQHPNDANAMNYLGYTWAERNENLQEALKLLQRSLLLSPGDGFITDSMGWVLFRLNRLEEALERMREAVRLESQDATIQEHLGDVLNAMGRKEEARAVWKKALQLEPKNKSLQKKLRMKAPSILP